MRFSHSYDPYSRGIGATNMIMNLSFRFKSNYKVFKSIITWSADNNLLIMLDQINKELDYKVGLSSTRRTLYQSHLGVTETLFKSNFLVFIQANIVFDLKMFLFIVLFVFHELSCKIVLFGMKIYKGLNFSLKTCKMVNEKYF